VPPISSVEILVGLLGVGITVTSLVLGYYERVYRPKIESNASLLDRHVASEATKTRNLIQLPMEPRLLQKAADRLLNLNAIARRPDDLLRWRTYQLVFLVLLAILAVGAFVDPSYPILNIPISWVAALTLLGLVTEQVASVTVTLTKNMEAHLRDVQDA
jgi:hypothetical protein